MKNLEAQTTQRHPLQRLKQKFAELSLVSALGSTSSRQDQNAETGKPLSYEEKRAQGRDRFRRIITLISLISFGGSISTGIVHTFSQASDADKPIQAVQQTEQLRRQQFSAEEQGYLIVLKREPNNQVALDGLAAVRIKMHDWKGAIEPLEKLVALNPGREDWKTLLENIKRRANQK